jgi:hypothetical protein
VKRENPSTSQLSHLTFQNVSPSMSGVSTFDKPAFVGLVTNKFDYPIFNCFILELLVGDNTNKGIGKEV